MTTLQFWLLIGAFLLLKDMHPKIAPAMGAIIIFAVVVITLKEMWS